MNSDTVCSFIKTTVSQDQVATEDPSNQDLHYF